MTLDLSSGREVFLDLVRANDVLVENFRPGTLERWGLGPDVLLEANPRLVIARVTAFGQLGPWAIHPSQLSIIILSFTPSASQVGDASGLLAAIEEAGAVEGGVIVLPDGRMVDPAMIGRAREVVALMQQIETRQS